MEETTEKTSGYAYYALALLTLVYVLNFLDRVLIMYLFTPIKQEFAFSDLQLALLGTTSFAIFYTALGIPFGRLADKGSRKMLIGVGLLVWSLFSGLTGFAWDFWSLFACRVMVGVGEATLGPAAISLLADYFPPKKRATVASIYSMGIAIGAGSAAFLGGWLGQMYGWRFTFMILGFPGVIFAFLVFALREKPRETVETESIIGTNWRLLISNKAFILLCLGYAFLGLATNNLSIWGATFYTRLHKFDLATIGFWGGILTLAAGIPATLYGGVIADKFRQKAKGGRMFYGALLSLASIPFWILLIFTSSPYLILLANFMLLFFALAWLGAAAADVTEIAGIRLRGLGIAIYFFMVNIFAYIIGSNVIGKLNDVLGATATPEMMRYALLVCPASCLLAAVCLYSGSRTLNRSEV
jgi:MFS family permease